MHGGFENETPNIPTNTIVKIDLTQIFKQNQILLTKLENALGPNQKKDKSEGGSRPGSTSPSENALGGSKTPPSSSGSKSPTIRFDNA